MRILNDIVVFINTGKTGSFLMALAVTKKKKMSVRRNNSNLEKGDGKDTVKY